MDGYSSKAWNSCFKDHLFQYGNKDCDGIDEKKKTNWTMYAEWTN